MGLIYSYKEKTNLTGSELIIGSDINQYKNPSISIKLESVKDYTADAMLQGTSPYVPVFDSTSDTLQNSIIQQNSNNPIDGISIGGAIDTVTNITASGNIALQGNLTGQGTITGGTVASTGDVTATGDVIATGNVTATGNVIATGGVTATGDVTGANGVYSNDVTITGNITAGGGTSVVNGLRGAAFGNLNQVAGNDSIATGHSSHTLGDDAGSIGHGNSAAGHGSFAAGWYTSAGNEGTAVYTASGTANTFTVENLVGTMTAGMYMYPFNITERREITNVVDNGNGTYDVTVAGAAVQFFEDARIFIESASPDRSDQYGTVALGHNAVSLGVGSVAIGRDAQANGANVVALGGASTQVQVANDLTVTNDLAVNGAALLNGNAIPVITSGTWTPTLGTNPGGSIVYTYTYQSGNWYAVGDMVIAMFQIQGTAAGVSTSSIVTISMPHDPDFDEPGGTIYDAGNGFSVKPIGFGRSFSDAHSGASILGVNGEILTAAEVNFSQQFNVIGQLIYKK